MCAGRKGRRGGTGRKVGERNSSSKDAQRFLRIKWMKAEKETKKAGACRHNHPVKSEWGKKNVYLLLHRDVLEFHTAITAYLE